MSGTTLEAIEEQVLVVPRSRVIDGAGWRGVRTGEPADVLDLLIAEGRFEPRSAVESDPRWKQVIPYLVMRDGSDYFLMQRTREGADARLHDRWSIGIGGHLNPGDGGIAGGLEREWREEIDAAFDPEPRFLGLLNDDFDRGRPGPPRGRVRGRRAGPVNRDPGDDQAPWQVRDAGRGPGPGRQPRELESARLRTARDQPGVARGRL